MYKRVFQRLSAVLLCAMLCVQLLPRTALAASYGFPADDLLSEAEQYSLTLSYPVSGNVTLTGAAFKLYRVATLTKDVQFHLEDSYKEYTASYGVVMKAESAQDWLRLASTLSSVIGADVTPDAESTLNISNQVHFEGLKQGLYLVKGEKATDERTGTVYTPMPFFAYLPYCEPDTNTWVKSTTLDIKYESQEVAKVSRQVVKQWDDAGLEHLRPASVTVELRRNGETWGTRTLSAENSWREMWEDLDSRYTWDVVEVQGQEGYTVSTVTQGETVIITNSCRPVPVPPAEPTPTPTPTPTPPSNPSNDPTTLTGPQPDPTPDRLPEGPNTTQVPYVYGPVGDNSITIDDLTPPLTNMPDFEDLDTYVPSDDVEIIEDNGVPLGKLPQTGLLWWPVPLLFVAGLSLFCAGMFLQRKGTHEEE